MLIPPILFIGGKGGVGKSTLSSAFAKFCANKGKKTLLISTDPAHNLSDIFSFIPSCEPKEVQNNLFILEIDASKEVISYVDHVSTITKQFVSASSYAMLDAYYENVKENGMAQESALFDRLIRIVTQEGINQKKWDQIVIDTAPTGHTLRLFSLPKTLREWSKTLLQAQEKSSHLNNILGHIEGKNPLKERIEERYLLYTQFSHLLHSLNTGVMFVMNPDKLSFEETKRAIKALNQEKLKVLALIINKVPPDSDDPFFKEQFEWSKKYLQEIENAFHGLLCSKVPLCGIDMLGSNGLEIIVQAIQRDFEV